MRPEIAVDLNSIWDHESWILAVMSVSIAGMVVTTHCISACEAQRNNLTEYIVGVGGELEW